MQTDSNNSSTTMSSEDIVTIVDAVTDILHEQEQDSWHPSAFKYFGPSSRTLMLYGEITEEKACAFISQLYELERMDKTSPIYIYINCPGGTIVDALAIYDTLKTISCPVTTVVSGGCFSAALLVACAGHERLATPNSMYFYHQPSLQVDVVFSAEEIEAKKDFYHWCKDTTNNVMRESINMDLSTWDRFFGDSSSKYFTAKEALLYGFATKILEHKEST